VAIRCDSSQERPQWLRQYNRLARGSAPQAAGCGSSQSNSPTPDDEALRGFELDVKLPACVEPAADRGDVAELRQTRPLLVDSVSLRRRRGGFGCYDLAVMSMVWLAAMRTSRGAVVITPSIFTTRSPHAEPRQ
jgi:hypothetical protein